MNFFNFILIAIFFSSCAKLNYLVEQGAGQLALQNRARPNELVLKDPRVSIENKRKLRLIKEYKKYFYDYFERNSTRIYNQTTMLKQDAVTYLVIASAFNEIKAHKECFPLMGCFPYLGFFDKKRALEYASRLEKKGMMTFVRPVYAYSTLGYFDDTVLSSFFYYDDYKLAELIFHELFHTIFFVKDEVDLNENLASYFGEMLAIEYFKLDNLELKKRMKQKKLKDKVNQKLVSLTRSLNDLYKQKRPTSKNDAKIILNNFLEVELIPQLKSLCQKEGISNCKRAHNKWNNASLAAFLTYRKSENKLASLRHDKSLKDFLHFLEQKYDQYKKHNHEKPFNQFIYF